MITYVYWIGVSVVAAAALYLVGLRLGRWKNAFILAGLILLIAWIAYFFYFQQLFVKRYGGVMRISVPKGQQHIAVTWKDDNLWVENYDPKTNECIFSEYSKGNLLQGRVIIRDCNPLHLDKPVSPTLPATR
jgi:hypothetical protein